MKSNIHPNWKHDTNVTCSCGATFLTGSSLGEITVDICSKCHPFFTGEERFVDIQGRVEKFKNRQQAATQGTGKKQKKASDKPAAPQKSLKDLLQGEKVRLDQTV